MWNDNKKKDNRKQWKCYPRAGMLCIQFLWRKFCSWRSEHFLDSLHGASSCFPHRESQMLSLIALTRYNSLLLSWSLSFLPSLACIQKNMRGDAVQKQIHNRNWARHVLPGVNRPHLWHDGMHKPHLWNYTMSLLFIHKSEKKRFQNVPIQPPKIKEG